MTSTRNKAIEDALRDLLERYVDMANSGDCGNWDPEQEVFVIDARAALALPEDDGWRDIESAPKWSGEGVPPYVLASDGKYVFVGYRADPNYPDDPEWCDEGGEFIEPQPTHWRPLPAPPKEG